MSACCTPITAISPLLGAGKPSCQSSRLGPWGGQAIVPFRSEAEELGVEAGSLMVVIVGETIHCVGAPCGVEALARRVILCSAVRLSSPLTRAWRSGLLDPPKILSGWSHVTPPRRKKAAWLSKRRALTRSRAQ
eukprot:3484459-Rhodomonas_salina.1